SLIQTIGRAARNANGRVILYAETVTDSMQRAIDETERRRVVQTAYNEAHGIVPTSVRRPIEGPLVESFPDDDVPSLLDPADDGLGGTSAAEIRRAMREAAENLDFERAAALRDRLREIESGHAPGGGGVAAPEPRSAVPGRGRAPGPARGGRRSRGART
ncbi:UvrB/UvrC motif-containing protein, partial [bacterium]|nr:UvrB/UvrC motif-containing protein [bacterium]